MEGPYIIFFVLLLAAASAFSTAVISWKRRGAPGSVPLTWLLLAISHWCLTSALHTVTPDMVGKILWAKVQYLAIASVPLLPPPFRRQSVMLLLGAVIPWIGNIAYLAHLIPVPGLDITPLAFTASGLLCAWGLFRERILDLVLVAHDIVIENMRDAVVVLDRHGSVVTTARIWPGSSFGRPGFLALTSTSCARSLSDAGVRWDMFHTRWTDD